MGKPRTYSDKPLKRNEPVELLSKLHKADSTKARRVLVSEAMGEIFYAFGEKRRAWRDWLDYEENFSRLFIGEVVIKKEKEA
jgi:hypothetical protein